MVLHWHQVAIVRIAPISNNILSPDLIKELRRLGFSIKHPYKYNIGLKVFFVCVILNHSFYRHISLQIYGNFSSHSAALSMFKMCLWVE